MNGRQDRYLAFLPFELSHWHDAATTNVSCGDKVFRFKVSVANRSASFYMFCPFVECGKRDLLWSSFNNCFPVSIYLN